eukprot:12568944-Prorocentrum_lima.AAC.1
MEEAALPELPPNSGEMKVVWDKSTGLPLDAGKVKKAQEDEMAFMAQFGVLLQSTRNECLAATEREPVPTQWLD